MREIWSSEGSLMSAFEPRPMVIVSPSAGSVQRCEPSDTANSVSTNTPPGSQPVCAILPARPALGPDRPAPMSLVTLDPAVRRPLDRRPPYGICQLRVMRGSPFTRPVPEIVHVPPRFSVYAWRTQERVASCAQ